MAVIIETCSESVVTESSKDTYVGSFIEDSKTVTEFDMRKRDWQKNLKTDSEIFRYKETYTADVCEFPAFHCPVIYGFVMARGYYIRADGGREYFTTEPSEVSAHHLSRNIIRPACFLAVICGVSLRKISLIYSGLFQVPVTESGIKRRIDEIGSGISEDDILKKLTDLKKPAECHIDAYYPPPVRTDV